MKDYKIFILDDHQLIIEGYKSILSLFLKSKNIYYIEATDCQKAFEKITSNAKNAFDIAILDWSIPEYNLENLHHGLDIGILIKQKMPKCKVIIITSFSDNTMIEKIVLKSQLEGMIVKSECTPKILADCFKAIINGENYFSETVNNYLANPIAKYNLDNTDLLLLEKLSIGIKNVNLPNYIGLSQSAIEKRKVKIKVKLNVEGNDEALIAAARKLGLIQ